MLLDLREVDLVWYEFPRWLISISIPFFLHHRYCAVCFYRFDISILMPSCLASPRLVAQPPIILLDFFTVANVALLPWHSCLNSELFCSVSWTRTTKILRTFDERTERFQYGEIDISPVVHKYANNHRCKRSSTNTMVVKGHQSHYNIHCAAWSTLVCLCAHKHRRYWELWASLAPGSISRFTAMRGPAIRRIGALLVTAYFVFRRQWRRSII